MCYVDLDVLQVHPSFKERQCLTKLVLENDAMAEITKPDMAATENKILTEFSPISHTNIILNIM